MKRRIISIDVLELIQFSIRIQDVMHVQLKMHLEVQQQHVMSLFMKVNKIFSLLFFIKQILQINPKL
jgi:hypothetical protein